MVKLVVFILITLLCFAGAYSQQDSTAQVDSALVKELERQMQAQTTESTPAAQPRSTISTNPNISVIGDFQTLYRSDLDRNFDFNFNESEVSFQSFVDPYTRADFFLSLAKDPTTGKFEADVEEAYLTTLELPAQLQLKAGKFRMDFGKINSVHPHALPFVDMPNAYVNYFGDDGLNSEGLSLSWLVPNPMDFYQELTFEFTEVPINSPSFYRIGANRFFYLAHLKNFWDLTPNATLELGLSGVTGPNSDSYTTSIGAVDLTYKWKPLQYNTYKSFTWQTEAFYSAAKVADTTSDNTWGLYSFLTYQIEKRWFLTGRFDYSNFPTSASLAERAYSASLGWYATEFQKIELEGKVTSSNFADHYTQAMIRWIFVIGTHGAHQY